MAQLFIWFLVSLSFVNDDFLGGVNEDYMGQLKYIFYVVNIWIGQPYLFVFRK